MPTYASGINLSKACMLIALDRILDPNEWDREFIHDYFLEFGENGFNTEHFYLIEESTPLMRVPNGTHQMSYDQGDDYIRIINHATLERYRIRPYSRIIYIYNVDDDHTHAVGIYADELLFYLHHTKYAAMFISRKGLIIDQVDGLE